MSMAGLTMVEAGEQPMEQPPPCPLPTSNFHPTAALALTSRSSTRRRLATHAATHTTRRPGALTKVAEHASGLSPLPGKGLPPEPLC